MQALKKFAKDKKGISALEYAILAGIIVVGVLGGTSFTGLGTKVGHIFTGVGTVLDSAGGTAAGGGGTGGGTTS